MRLGENGKIEVGDSLFFDLGEIYGVGADFGGAEDGVVARLAEAEHEDVFLVFSEIEPAFWQVVVALLTKFVVSAEVMPVEIHVSITR